MKILHILGSSGFGGTERMFAATIRALEKRGRTVNVGFIVDGGMLLRDGGIAHAPENGRFWSGMGLADKVARVAGAPASIFKAVIAERPDIIYAYDSPLDVFISAAAGRMLGCKVVARNSCKVDALPLPSRLLMRLAFPLCDKVIALSEDGRKELEGLGVRGIAVIPNGKGMPEFFWSRSMARRKLGVKPGEFAVGVIARIAPVKRQELAIKALSGTSGMRLVLIGNEECEAYGMRLRGLALELGLADRVTFAGYRKDVDRLICGLDAILHTSASEACPGALIEGMMAGLPAVAVDEPAAREVMGNSGIIVRATPDSVSVALNKLKESRSLRRDCGRKSRQRAKMFGIEAMAQGYETLFGNLAASEEK